MTLRIIDADQQLERALAAIEQCAAAWGGGRAEAWEAYAGAHGQDIGASYVTRPDAYLAIERSPRRVAIAIAVAEDDRDVLRIEIDRRAPAAGRRDAALAEDAGGAVYALISLEHLRAQEVRDPLARLAGLPGVRRAIAAGREYALLGPFNEPAALDSMMALAALSPGFERAIDRLALTPGVLPREILYRVDEGAARAARAAPRVLAAVARRFETAGYRVEPAGRGLRATRGASGVRAFALACAARDQFVETLGEAALCGEPALVFAPMARDPSVWGPMEAALDAIGMGLCAYVFVDGAPAFDAAFSKGPMSAELRAAFA